VQEPRDRLVDFTPVREHDPHEPEMLHLELGPTDFPYTTLFRSTRARRTSASACRPRGARARKRARSSACSSTRSSCARTCRPGRSEEHTSELQSRENLVCRLLLEKKKKIIKSKKNTTYKPTLTR